MKILQEFHQNDIVFKHTTCWSTDKTSQQYMWACTYFVIPRQYPCFLFRELLFPAHSPTDMKPPNCIFIIMIKNHLNYPAWCTPRVCWLLFQCIVQILLNHNKWVAWHWISVKNKQIKLHCTYIEMCEYTNFPHTCIHI